MRSPELDGCKYHLIQVICHGRSPKNDYQLTRDVRSPRVLSATWHCQRTDTCCRDNSLQPETGQRGCHVDNHVRIRGKLRDVHLVGQNQMP
ncbi:0559bcaf-c4dd-40c6-836c-aa97a3bebe90 [Thermothielavioides terrestris]|uniref:0559bcaf-c4dd-40c6-836c-aa97a3bebe90 n=1 Tax=Thermothielavioides terrestris TaxID=2587410 RepID=A0A446BPQ1_9PEZI|nr:0559bcaf-c4dd-40c6-836c-aa97a3bebe90 [Thermothielavioides terrestris]